MQVDNAEHTPLIEAAASSHAQPPGYPPASALGNIPTADTQSSEGKTPIQDTACKFGDISQFWTHVDKMTNQDHEELVKGLKSNLDNLL